MWLPSLCMTFWMNIFQTSGIVVVHHRAVFHYPGHHIVLTLPWWTAVCGALVRGQVAVCGALVRGKWLCSAVNSWLHGAVEQPYTTCITDMSAHFTQNTAVQQGVCLEHGAHIDTHHVHYLLPVLYWSDLSLCWLPGQPVVLQVLHPHSNLVGEWVNVRGM